VPHRLGIITDSYAEPLFRILREKEHQKFIFLENNPAELAIKLRQKELDGAFLSPIDYAKDYSMYRIIPEVAAVSRKESNTVNLFFTRDAHTIKRIGADPSYASEIVLANIILAEKYEIHAQIVPTTSGVSCLGREADAFLACGDLASKLTDYQNKLDLVDEWHDITELPFVHGFWVTREGSLTDEEIGLIIENGKAGLKKMKDSDTSQEHITFSYLLGEEEIQAVGEFFRMAYYHGILKDIPDIKFIKI